MIAFVRCKSYSLSFLEGEEKRKGAILTKTYKISAFSFDETEVILTHIWTPTSSAHLHKLKDLVHYDQNVYFISYFGLAKPINMYLRLKLRVARKEF